MKPLDVMKLLRKNIESRPVWKMHMQPFFTDMITGGVAVLFENGVCLPSDTK